MAAVLACGDDAALSHRAAAALWQLMKPRAGPIDVTVPGNGGRRRQRGIRLHRSTTLTARHVTVRNGIPVTTPARTIDDLRPVVPARLYRSAVRQAELLGRPLNAAFQPDGTRSDLELLFLRLCRRHGLPTPEVNVCIGPYEVDFLWREARLVVEVDGYAYHSSRRAFERDRRRDADLQTAGYDVMRITWRQITDEPIAVVARLAQRLSSGKWR
jgi:very-short-patch-repair endonuclease